MSRWADSRDPDDARETACLETFFDGLIADNDRLREKYESLRDYGVPDEEVVRSLKRAYDPKPYGYDSVPSSPRSGGMDVKKIDRLINGKDAETIGRDLQADSSYVVYFAECELIGGPRLKDAKRKSADILPSVDEAPDWVYYAWKADSVYYIGQTSDFGTRLKAHCCHVRRGDGAADEPSMLTGISNVTRAGVVERVDSRSRAKELEKAVGETWSTEHKQRFVYYA